MSTADVGPQHLFDHAGAWTEEAWLALPADRRIELVDGSLLVAPSTDEHHARAVAAVRAAVAAVLPDGLEVTGPVALRLAPGRILVPDLVVAARRGDDPEPGGVRDSSVALVVIDVVGSGNGVADRWFKPQLYAGSRIPYALLIDRDEPFAVGSMLIGGRYHEYGEAGAGEVLRLEEPFVLELDLAALTAVVEPFTDDVDTPSAGIPAVPAADGPPDPAAERPADAAGDDDPDGPGAPEADAEAQDADSGPDGSGPTGSGSADDSAHDPAGRDAGDGDPADAPGPSDEPGPAPSDDRGPVPVALRPGHPVLPQRRPADGQDPSLTP
jgi:hypothetical protein